MDITSSEPSYFRFLNEFKQRNLNKALNLHTLIKEISVGFVKTTTYMGHTKIAEEWRYIACDSPLGAWIHDRYLEEDFPIKVRVNLFPKDF